MKHLSALELLHSAGVMIPLGQLRMIAEYEIHEISSSDEPIDTRVVPSPLMSLECSSTL